MGRKQKQTFSKSQKLVSSKSENNYQTLEDQSSNKRKLVNSKSENDFQTSRSLESPECIELLTIDAIPEWARDNLHIFGGYRHLNLGWKLTVKSLCLLHNETMNIWTHMIGFWLVLGLMVFTWTCLSPHGVDYIEFQWPDLHLMSYSNDVLPSNLRMGDKYSEPACFTIHPDQCGLSEWECPVDMCEPADTSQRLLGFFAYHSSYLRELLDRMKERTGFYLAHLGESELLPWSEHHQLSKPNPAGNFPQDESTLHSLSNTVRDVIHQVEMEGAAVVNNARDKVGSAANAAQEMAYKVGSAANAAQEMAQHYTQVLSRTLLTIKTTVLQTRSMSVPQAKKKLEEVGEMCMEQVEAAITNVPKFSSLLDTLGAKRKDLLNATQSIFDAFTLYIAQFVPMEGATISSDSDHPPSIVRLLSADDRLVPGVVPFLPLWPIAVYMGTAMICLGLSSFYHLFSAVSPAISVVFQLLDYAGITLLIGGSNIPLIFYGFFCSPVYRNVYMSITGTISICGFLAMLCPSFLSHKFRTMRAVMFLMMGFSGIIPGAHMLIHLEQFPPPFIYVIIMGILYVAGAMIYLHQIPESCAPGRFDLFCSSHQWWHVFVLAALLVHYYGIVQFFQWRITTQCPA